MTSFNIAKRILVAKRESVKGTAETLADADFDVRMRGIEFTPDYKVVILKASLQLVTMVVTLLSQGLKAQLLQVSRSYHKVLH